MGEGQIGESDGFEVFASLLIEQLQEQVDSEITRVDDGSVELEFEEGNAKVNLRSLYETYRMTPPELQGKTMDRFVAMLTEGTFTPELSDFDAIRSRLRPKVWSRWSFAAMALQSLVSGESAMPEMPTRLLGDHLILTFVLDSEEMMSTVDWESFRRWGRPFEDVLAIAIENADADTAMLGVQGTADSPGQCTMATQDNYDSIRFLSEMPYLQMEIGLPRWAFSAARDSCVICNADCHEHIDMLLQMAFETSEEDPKPLPPFPLVNRTGLGWTAWKPEPGHQLSDNVIARQRDYLMEIYADQRGLLQVSSVARKDFAFAAALSVVSDVELSVMGLESGENGQGTSTTWQSGTECLLPEAEFVVFADHDNAVVRWDRLMSECPELLALAEAIYPRRWRTYGYPSSDQIAKMTAVS